MSQKDITDGNCQYIRGTSEKPTHGPQVTLNHLKVFLWNPCWKFSQSGVPLVCWYARFYCLPKSLDYTAFRFLLVCCLRNSWSLHLDYGHPSKSLPNSSSLGVLLLSLKSPRWFLYFSSLERLTIFYNFIVFYI